jgi:uncharacterized protein (DUF885 family)
MTRDERIDARLLAARLRSEIEKWEKDRPHENDLALYADPISRGAPRVADSPKLSPQEKIQIIRGHFDRVEKLCLAAMQTLGDGRPGGTKSALQRLETAALYFERELPEAASVWLRGNAWTDFAAKSKDTSIQIRSLVRHVEDKVSPNTSLPDEPILGRDSYARKLEIYTDSDMTPEQLADIALKEIANTKQRIFVISREYWRTVHPGREPPSDFSTVVGEAFEDLESNRPTAEQEYLEKLRQYAAEAEAFVREKNLVTLPDKQTLSIELAPESSGPMARIGYVRSAPPFHPNPWTTWYLATIPDSHPEKEREEFWRSFNYSFKRFIVIHELFPGHYIQNKILRENLHPIRILFRYGPYSEGWATLCEKVALEAGWAEGDYLTRLAQLRKRLENANRAYTSVQAHCYGWDEEKVNTFSIETSLLAPQFAKSLWGRLMRSPLQITSYMLGTLQFEEVYEAERKRRGDAFRPIDFMDTALRTGPIPIDELTGVLKEKYP